MPKCILAYIFQRKMFSVHFPKENVQLCKNAVFFALQKTKMLCKNAFLHHILFCKNAFLHQQNVTNAFDAKMHFGNAYIFLCKMFSITFSFGKCSASHFTKENVQHQQNVRAAQPPMLVYFDYDSFLFHKKH